MTVVFEHGTLFYGKQNNIDGAFDADINMEVCNRKTNADLTIYLRIHFNPKNPSSGYRTFYFNKGTQLVQIQKWNPSEWVGWKSKFIRICQKKWNGRFWLETPESYNGLNWPRIHPTHRCNLYCKFRLTEVSSKPDAHFTVDVVHVVDNQYFQSDMNLYSNNDINDIDPTKSVYRTCYHEVGHLIGLDHPGKGFWPTCITDREPICYRDPKGNDRGVMGHGSLLFKRHANPWIFAASKLTGVAESDWKVHGKYIPPQRIK